MSIVRLIAPFAQASGKFSAPNAQAAASAVVAMPDKYGRTLLRNFVVPTNPNTLYQQQARSSLTSISEALQSLSQPQVDDWQALATAIILSGRLGLNYRLSWTSLFQRVNAYNLLRGLDIVYDAPDYTINPAPTNVSLSTEASGDEWVLSFTVTDPSYTVGGLLSFRITRNLGSPNRQARDTELRYPADPDICIAARVGPGSHVYEITADRLNVPSGTYVGIEILAITDESVPGSRLFKTNVLTTITPP